MKRKSIIIIITVCIIAIAAGTAIAFAGGRSVDDVNLSDSAATPQSTQETPVSEPTAVPTEAPTGEPIVVPTEVPTTEPTVEPTPAPTEAPTETPTAEPTMVPTEAPTAAPTATPTLEPTPDPTVESTMAPTEAPTLEPTAVPTPEPVEEPEPEAEPEPTAAPTPEPTAVPTEVPTPEPTAAPCSHNNTDVDYYSALCSFATCTSGGYGKIMCLDCGEFLGWYSSEPLGHNPDEETWESENVCAKYVAGSGAFIQIKCTRCGNNLENRPVTATHDFRVVGQDRYTQGVICLIYDIMECMGCGMTYNENMQECGYDFDADGLCDNCGGMM